MTKTTNNQLTEVFITDEVLLICHHLALLTEKEEVAALLIGQVGMYHKPQFYCCLYNGHHLDNA